MRRFLSPRWLAAAAALLLLGLSLQRSKRETAARLELEQQWERTGEAARHAKAASRARRDPDPAASDVALARILFTDAYDIAALATLPRAEAAAEARRAEQRLTLAGTFAEAGLARRPSSWESAMILGAVRMVAAWRRNDDSLYAHPERWRSPLRHAATLAPGSPEPTRLLLTGYLAAWHALSAEDRGAARRLLRVAFRDPETLAEMLPAWTAVAGTRRELEEVLPAAPAPYDLLQQAAARRQDWKGFCAARERWLPLTLRALESRLGEAERRLAGGDQAGGASDLVATAVAAPPDRRTAPLFARAIEQLPAGQVSSSQGRAFQAWLAWSLALWQLDMEALPAPVVARIAGLTPELPPSRAALAALAAGDLARGEILERRDDRLWSEEWAPYATAKAEMLLARGHPEEAAATLDEVHRTFQERFSYLRARERLAAARHEPTPASLSSLMATSWGGERWLYQSNEAALELVAARPARALVVAVDVAPPEGAAVELALDGLGAGCFPVHAGAVLRLPLAPTAGPHRLVWRTLAGERTAPGRVELSSPAAPAPVVGAGGR